MNEFLLRVLYVLRLVAFMGVVYMGLHVLIAPLIRKPDSKIAAFFTLLTSPLVRLVRGFVPPGTPEPRLRLLTLFALLAVWVALLAVSAVVARSVI
jgi:hypothetical protein